MVCSELFLECAKLISLLIREIDVIDKIITSVDLGLLKSDITHHEVNTDDGWLLLLLDGSSIDKGEVFSCLLGEVKCTVEHGLPLNLKIFATVLLIRLGGEFYLGIEFIFL